MTLKHGETQPLERGCAKSIFLKDMLATDLGLSRSLHVGVQDPNAVASFASRMGAQRGRSFGCPGHGTLGDANLSGGMASRTLSAANTICATAGGFHPTDGPCATAARPPEFAIAAPCGGIERVGFQPDAS